jgi:flagellar basal body-associated protein FliL
MKNEKGQTMIILIFFVMTALALTIAAIFMLTINAGSTTDLENGIALRQLADSGTENALIKLERDPSYSGETYITSNTTITIIVTGSNAKTIITSAEINNLTRKVEVLVDYNNNILRVNSWKEIL